MPPQKPSIFRAVFFGFIVQVLAKKCAKSRAKKEKKKAMDYKLIF